MHVKPLKMVILYFIGVVGNFYLQLPVNML